MPLNAPAPKIPGVPGQAAQKSDKATQSIVEDVPHENRRASSLWPAAGGAILGIVVVLSWWAHSAKAPKDQQLSTDLPQTASRSAPSAQTGALPIAPGPIATVAEMKAEWSTKQFVYKEANGDKTPALLVHLPKNAYWAISLREPFGTCQLEFAGVQKLQSDYNLAAPYPMIGDPCSHAVFDLAQYGEGPNGMVRGAVVAGAAVRPPLAIEVNVNDGKIIASQEEEAVKVQ